MEKQRSHQAHHLPHTSGVQEGPDEVDEMVVAFCLLSGRNALSKFRSQSTESHFRVSDRLSAGFCGLRTTLYENTEIR